MASSIIYPYKQLESKIKVRHYIPYRINHSDKYEVNRVYYNAYWRQTLQVLDIGYYDDGSMDNAQVKWEDGCYGLICTDLCSDDYLLVKDKKRINEVINIINTGKAYTGAEIIYWFWLHNINQFNGKYKMFWEWVDYFSDRRLQDRNKYLVYGTERDGIYINCKIYKVK